MHRLPLLILLLGLLWPGTATAGGIAVKAPEALGAADCIQGRPAAFTGFRPDPVPPTVIGCIGRGERGALIAVTRDLGFRAAEICLFVVPAGRRHADESCSSLTEVIREGQARSNGPTLRVDGPLAQRLGATGPFEVAPDLDRPADLIIGGIDFLIEAFGEVLGVRAEGFLEPPFASGRSAKGRTIRVRQYGDPGVEGELLVFGCIHGDECAARGIRPISGCPLYDANIRIVGNLNPDGYALGSRLNGRGVDLNRNFPVDWKPIGQRGSPQFSGPRPFSEPESVLAAQIIQRLRPEVTIWFHQHAGPAFVRAWGPSVPWARRYAKLANLPFRRMPWLAGTAPNWQNHAFPGTASFVVELPDGAAGRDRISTLGSAVARLGREIGGDG